MKRMTALLSGLLMLCLLVTQVYAVPVPDMNRVGSVSVTFVYEQKPVASGSLTLYRVAEVSLKNSADYSFRLTEEYAGSGVSKQARLVFTCSAVSAPNTREETPAQSRIKAIASCGILIP